MALNNSQWFGSTAGFYNDVATQSLRINSSADGRLEKTPNASNRKTWTWSAWVKRSRLSVSRAIWSVTSSAHFSVFLIVMIN